MVSFDDATSFGIPHTRLSAVFTDLSLYHTAAKGKFISEAGLAGFAMWETGGDSDDILLDAISEGIRCSTLQNNNRVINVKRRDKKTK
jgi:hypothetical protein